jgi:hypothetical protein
MRTAPRAAGRVAPGFAFKGPRGLTWHCREPLFIRTRALIRAFRVNLEKSPATVVVSFCVKPYRPELKRSGALYDNIMRKLVGPSGTQGFIDIATKTLQAAGIADAAAKASVVYVAAKIRNSKHANGIHGRPLQRIQWEELFSSSRKGRKSNGSWFHILTALQASIEVSAEVLKSAKVTGIAY